MRSTRTSTLEHATLEHATLEHRYSKYAPQLVQSERELPSHNAANDFVKDLSIQYEKSPRLLQRFFYILREFARKSIGVHAVMNQVANLLGNRLDFMIRFNRFLPDDSWMEDLQQFRALEDRNKEIETKDGKLKSHRWLLRRMMQKRQPRLLLRRRPYRKHHHDSIFGYTTNEMDMTRARIF